MKQQNYKNYIRFYPPHHFVFYPVTLLLLGTGIYFSIFREQERLIWIFLTVLLVLIIWVSFMLRQHYSLLLQDRIIRLEVKYRYFTLTGKRFEELSENLSDSQIFALRFASDEEFPELAKTAVLENWSSEKIKKNIKNWKPDEYRV